VSFTVTSVNVNGIRAATRVRSEENKGFLAWLNTTSSDVVCIQEVRATPEQALTALAPALVDNGGSWYFSMQEAAAKGRGGGGPAPPLGCQPYSWETPYKTPTNLLWRQGIRANGRIN